MINDNELMVKDLKILNLLKNRIVSLLNNYNLSNKDINYIISNILPNFYDITVLDLFKLADIFQISISELCDIDRGL